MVKICYSGTQSTGKTTSVYKKILELKDKYKNAKIDPLLEVARDCPLPLNENTTRESQLWIFNTQIKRELDKISKADYLVGDRTCIDAIAYAERAGFKYLAKAMKEIAEYHLESYDYIYYKRLKDNDYFVSDNFRSNSKSYREEIEEIMFSIYIELKVEDKTNFKII